MRPRRLPSLLVAGAALVLLVSAAGYRYRAHIPAHWLANVRGWLDGTRVDHGVRITMPDGVTLAASLYLPAGFDPNAPGERLATIYIALPYNRRRYDEALNAALFFAEHGYAVLLQDVRGKFGSEGRMLPWRHASEDGAATLDWIAGQRWSNGKVGTFGCSALGELQYALAQARHPSHDAMLVMGAGGAIGSAQGTYEYFGLFEGGIFQLASGFGWFRQNGGRMQASAPPPPGVDIPERLRELPIIDLMRGVSPAPEAYEAFLRRPLADPSWEQLDFVSRDDRIATPTLVINTWGDQTVDSALALAEFVRTRAPANAPVPQHVVIAPGDHCAQETVADEGRFGELEVENADQPYSEWNLRWFDYWLRGRGEGLAELPPYLYFVLNENRWLGAPSWPPPASRVQRWHLVSAGHANGRAGDGVLSRTPDASPGFDQYLYDPADPVPTLGGPICCTGNPSTRSGPVDQAQVERRDDVLVYTSAPLREPLRIAGRLRARLMVSSSARDTDFVARLVDVWPDGRATNIQEGALRARYRHGIADPELMRPGQVYPLTVDMRSIAYLVPAGHRLRLDITSSSFPRLARNLNTGGRNYDESRGVVARNRIHHGGPLLSYLELPVLTLPGDG